MPRSRAGIPTFATSIDGPFVPGAAIKGALRTAYVFAHMKPSAMKEVAAKVIGDRPSRRPAEHIEQHADRMRIFSVADSGSRLRDGFRVYMLRLATLIARSPQQYALGWKQSGRGAAEAGSPKTAPRRSPRWPIPAHPSKASGAKTIFSIAKKCARRCRWSAPVTRARLFEAANRYAEKQLQLHAQYAAWTGLTGLAASVAELQAKLTVARNGGSCLLAIGWGAGFLSKSAAIGAEGEQADEHRRILGALPYYERAIKSGLPFPKTRRIVFLKNKPATLPGWVELDVEGSPAPPALRIHVHSETALQITHTATSAMTKS